MLKTWKNKLILIEPLRTNARACIYTLFTLALVIVYLHKGTEDFFIEHIASKVLDQATRLEVEWWGTIYQFASTFVLFFMVPATLLKLVAHENLGKLGLGFGDWKFGFLVVVPFGYLILAVPAGIFAYKLPDFQATYPLAKLALRDPCHFVIFELAYGVLYYIAYEALFRGFLQLGLQRYIGNLSSILVQTAVTTLFHIGKPEAEVWAALLAGFVFGAVIVRTRSIWPLVALHWGIGILTDIGANLGGAIWHTVRL